MTTLSAFNRFTDNLSEQEQLMPVLFVGHGSPMNGIEDNAFSQYWKKLAKEMPTPNAVLVVSAHGREGNSVGYGRAKHCQ